MQITFRVEIRCLKVLKMYRENSRVSDENLISHFNFCSVNFFYILILFKKFCPIINPFEKHVLVLSIEKIFNGFKSFMILTNERRTRKHVHVHAQNAICIPIRSMVQSYHEKWAPRAHGQVDRSI